MVRMIWSSVLISDCLNTELELLVKWVREHTRPRTDDSLNRLSFRTFVRLSWKGVLGVGTARDGRAIREHCCSALCRGHHASPDNSESCSGDGATVAGKRDA